MLINSNNLIYKKLISHNSNLLSTLSPLFFKLAERYEKRFISSKMSELKRYYRIRFNDRKLLQKEKVIKLIDYCFHHSEFYKDLISRSKFNINKLKKDFNYFKDFPIIDKQCILNNYELFNCGISSKKKIITTTTGGSTGAKLKLFFDQTTVDYSSAVTRYCRDFINHGLSKISLNIATGNPEEFFEWPNKEFFKCLSLNRRNFFINNYSDNNLEELLSFIEYLKPKLIHCHPSTMFLLANYSISKKPLNHFFVFEPSGETLTNKMRKSIIKSFNCKIFNRYGLAEFGIVAYDFSSSGDSLFILDSEAYVESDSNRIIITGLRNFSTPLIKYDTGDLGSIFSNDDGYFLYDIKGRVHDNFEVNGKTYLTHTIQDIIDNRIGDINFFQIKITKKLPIMYLYVDQNMNTDEHLLKVKYFFKNDFEYNYIKENNIKLTGTRNKFRYIVK
jgi:phenylacetate-CoA ligase